MGRSRRGLGQNNAWFGGRGRGGLAWEFLVLGWGHAEMWPTVTGFGEGLLRTGPEMY